MAQFDDSFFDKIDSEQKAYALGLLQSDGSFSCKGRLKGYYRYKLSVQAADRDIIDKLRKHMNHTGKISVQTNRKDNRQDLIELSLNGIGFTEKLRGIFGGYLKEDRTNFPVLDRGLLRHYVRGVFDADGSAGIYGRTGTLVRIDGKKAQLESIQGATGFVSYIRKGNGTTTYTLKIYSSEAERFLEWIYSDLDADSLYIDRKYRKALDILSEREAPLCHFSA